MNHLPTIKDVALAAGVHFTTVSMALRGDPRLRPETRDRIFAAVARVGYRRNEISDALSHRRARAKPAVTPAIAYVTNRAPEEGLFQLTFFRRLLQGARDQAEALGYDLHVLYVTDGHHSSQSLWKHLVRNRIKGVIIGAFEPTRQALVLPWDELCVVKIDSRHMPPACAFVSNDQMDYVRLAFRRLRALGYRRIGLAVGADDESASDGLNTCGLLLEQAGLDPRDRVEPLLFPPGAHNAAEAARALDPWIEQYSVDAIVSNWTFIRKMVSAAGRRCPEDIACACVCMAKRIAGMAGVVANLEMVGREVVRLLAAQLQSEDYGIPRFPSSTYVQGTWYDGPSAPRRI